MKKGESRLEVSKMGVILFLGSSLSLESEELCVGGGRDFGEGSNCGNVSSFLSVCLFLPRFRFRGSKRNHVVSECLILPRWFIGDTRSITVAGIQHIIFHCCDLIYIFELLYVDADIKQKFHGYNIQPVYNFSYSICRIADRHPWMINYTLKFQCIQRFSTLLYKIFREIHGEKYFTRRHEYLF